MSDRAIESSAVEDEAIQSNTSISNPGDRSSITGLEAKLDKLLDVMTLFVQSQVPTQTKQEKKKRESQVSAPVDELMQQEDKPRKYRVGEAEPIINRAIDAIIQHNDHPGQLHDLKWAITINGLKNFSPNQRAIERVITQRKDEIDRHHKKHQLHSRHNDRHKRKRKINQVIRV